MAFWNSPNAVDGHAAVACAAALEQQALLAALRRRLVARGLPPLRARMGLSCGTVLHGNIGSRRRMECNVIGDEVIVIFVVVLASAAAAAAAAAANAAAAVAAARFIVCNCAENPPDLKLLLVSGREWRSL